MFLKNFLNFIKKLFGKKVEVKSPDPKWIDDKEMLDIQKENEKVELIKNLSPKPLSLIQVQEQPEVIESFEDIIEEPNATKILNIKSDEVKKMDEFKEPKKKNKKKDNKPVVEKVEDPKIESENKKSKKKTKKKENE